jgi:hypothetical protein
VSADERYGGASPTYKLVSLGIKAAEPASAAALVSAYISQCKGSGLV